MKSPKQSNARHGFQLSGIPTLSYHRSFLHGTRASNLTEPRVAWTSVGTDSTSGLLDVMVKDPNPISIPWFPGSTPCILWGNVSAISSAHISYPREWCPNPMVYCPWIDTLAVLLPFNSHSIDCHRPFCCSFKLIASRWWGICKISRFFGLLVLLPLILGSVESWVYHVIKQTHIWNRCQFW